MELVKADTDFLSQEALRRLIEPSTAQCLSLYMPTERRGAETQQNAIRLRNLVREVETVLRDDEMRQPDIDVWMEPIHRLVEDHDFWQHQSSGLALFRTSELFEYYRLPISFAEQTILASTPHIKPLLPLLSKDGKFYLLTLSRNQVRFFEGTPFQIGEIELGDTPTSLAEAMNFDDSEDQLQFHTQTGQNRGGERSAIFYGHNNAGDDAVIKENVKRFLQQVDVTVCNLIPEEHAPLVLAGVEEICGLYNEVSKYANVVKENLTGNPEMLSPETLHEQAWPLVEPSFATAQQQAIDSYLHLAGTDDRRASSDLKEIVSGAYFQRVATLFVPLEQQQWGVLNPESNEVQLHAEQQRGDVDLFDFAAVHTLLNGGVIYGMAADQIPGQQLVACIFRY